MARVMGEWGCVNKKWEIVYVSLMQERTKIEKRRKMVGQSDGVGGNDIPFSVDPCKYGP